jgi:hypothetical protein
MHYSISDASCQGGVGGGGGGKEKSETRALYSFVFAVALGERPKG